MMVFFHIIRAVWFTTQFHTFSQLTPNHQFPLGLCILAKPQTDLTKHTRNSIDLSDLKLIEALSQRMNRASIRTSQVLSKRDLSFFPNYPTGFQILVCPATKKQDPKNLITVSLLNFFPIRVFLINYYKAAVQILVCQITISQNVRPVQMIKQGKQDIRNCLVAETTGKGGLRQSSTGSVGNGVSRNKISDNFYQTITCCLNKQLL